MTRHSHYAGVPCRAMKPTQKHRVALFECMLGTLYAVNDKNEVKYFDYDYEAAYRWAGVTKRELGDRDARVYRRNRRDGRLRINGRQPEAVVGVGKLALYVKRIVPQRVLQQIDDLKADMAALRDEIDDPSAHGEDVASWLEELHIAARKLREVKSAWGL